MSALFKRKESSLLKSSRMEIRVTELEAEKIRSSASSRQLDVSTFIRRAALGRKANVDYETETVIALMRISRSLRELHTVLVEQGIPPMKEDIRPIVTNAINAMLRISK